MSSNIIFMGTPEFAVPILDSIKNSKHKILTVYTNPPKKSNRGQKINLSPIHIYANEAKINPVISLLNIFIRSFSKRFHFKLLKIIRQTS